MTGPAPDHGPTADWPTLQRRDQLLRQVRDFFRQRHFLEVETPVLSADVVVDRHLDPIPVTLPAPANALQSGPPLWLQTSPEFLMKRLLAGGAEAIFQVARAFRAGERGRLHNPEFTLVEWYRTGDSLEQAVGLLAELAESLLQRGPVQTASYRDLFQQHVGVNPHRCSAAELAEAARRRQLSFATTPDDDDVDAWRFLLMSHCVEPQLGVDSPLIVCHYPASQAALARTVELDGDTVAERFELYADGMELANGYHELLDPDELLRRNAEVNRQRRADGKPELPERSRLLAAMQSGLPPCSGVALGLDRLLMCLVGADHIDQVLPFPIERA